MRIAASMARIIDHAGAIDSTAGRYRHRSAIGDSQIAARRHGALAAAADELPAEPLLLPLVPLPLGALPVLGDAAAGLSALAAGASALAAPASALPLAASGLGG